MSDDKMTTPTLTARLARIENNRDAYFRYQWPEVELLLSLVRTQMNCLEEIEGGPSGDTADFDLKELARTCLTKLEEMVK